MNSYDTQRLSIPASLILTTPLVRVATWARLFAISYCAIAVACLCYGRFLFAATYLLISIAFLLRPIGTDVFAPVTLTLHAFGLYFLVPMLFDSELRSSTLLYIAATLFLFLLFFLSLPRLNLRLLETTTERVELKKNALPLAAWMLVAGMVLFLVSTRLAGFSKPWDVLSAPLQYRFFMMVGGMTYFKKLVDFLILSPAIVAGLARYSGTLSGKARFALYLAPACLYSIATGERGTIIILISEVLIIRHLLFRRISLRLIVLWALLLIPFIAFMGEYRMLRYSQQGASAGNVTDRLNAARMLAATASRFDAASSFNRLMSVYDFEPLHLGSSYLALPIQLVPRAIWPGKPRLPNPEMTRIVGMDDPELDIAFDFGMFGETLINFGWAGPLIGAAMLAGAVGVSQCLYEIAVVTHRPFAVLSAALLWTITLGIVVTGFVEAVVATLFALANLAALRVLLFARDVEPRPAAGAGTVAA